MKRMNSRIAPDRLGEAAGGFQNGRCMDLRPALQCRLSTLGGGVPRRIAGLSDRELPSDATAQNRDGVSEGKTDAGKEFAECAND